MITDIELHILDLIHNYLSCSFLDYLMPKITFLGNIGLIWICIATLMLSIKKYRKTGVTLSIGLFGGVITGNLILKNIIRRERPCWINNSIQMLVDIPQDYSFPSGHTLSSFMAASVIMHADKKLGIIAYIIASLIAFSRLYLYVHFPTDVIAGIFLGTIIGITSCKISERFIFPKFKVHD